MRNIWFVVCTIVVVSGAVVQAEGERCPICRMSIKEDGYDEKWYVVLKHGQRIYTCGMTTGDDYEKGPDYFSHPVQLSATMVDWVMESSECVFGCPDCRNESLSIKDPISGDAITAANPPFLCFNYGQKLFFKTQVSKGEFLNKITTTPNFGVESLVCNGKKCPDEGKYVVTKESSSPNNQTDPPFCTGASVMFNGFGSTMDNTCVRLYFKPWVLDTRVKYAFGVIGVFIMAMCNQLVIKHRTKVQKSLAIYLQQQRYNNETFKYHRIGAKFILAVLYALQMTLAYFLMLVVMIYDSILFVILVLGFGTGFFMFSEFSPVKRAHLHKMRKDSFSDPNASWVELEGNKCTILKVDGMKCMNKCGNAIRTALLNLNSNIQVTINIDEKLVYVYGPEYVATDKLIEEVQSIGYSADILQ